MKRPTIFIIGAVLLTVAGCVPSLHPIYTEEKLVFEKALIGQWSDTIEEDEGEIWTFERNGEKTYNLVIIEKEDIAEAKKNDEAPEEALFTVHLVKLDKTMFLDLYPEDPQIKNDFYKIHLIPAMYWALM